MPLLNTSPIVAAPVSHGCQRSEILSKRLTMEKLVNVTSASEAGIIKRAGVRYCSPMSLCTSR